MLSFKHLLLLREQLALMSSEDTKTVLASLEVLRWQLPGSGVSSEVLLQ